MHRRAHRSRRNPSRSGLLSYQSSVQVGGGGLSPLESTFILGGLVLVAGGITWLMLRPAAVPSASSASAPVPPSTPVQPVPYTPGSPGY